jgi:hypothetical protein
MIHGFPAMLVPHCYQPIAMPLAQEVLRTLQRLTIWSLDALVAYVRVAADHPGVAIAVRLRPDT